MAVTNDKCNIRLVWDDTVVLVYEFTDSGGTARKGAFVHLGSQATTGQQTQASSTVQNIAQVAWSSDPGGWVETLKNAARQKTQVDMWFEDTVFTPWMPPSMANANFTSFNISAVYSIAG